MTKVRIVTDSTADIPKEIVEELGIIVVPLKVSFGTEVYRDGVDITSAAFISRLQSATTLPTTSQPSPGEFVALYEKLIAKGDTIISIHISSKLSGTMQSAQTAKTVTDSRNIYIVDSKSASLGLGLMVIAAAKAARENKSVHEILSMIKEKVDNSFILFLVETLDYLEKGGRIGKANALLGSLLKIKPILTIDDEGQVIPLEKVRGTSKALLRLSQIVAERINDSKRYSCALVYGDDYTNVINLKEQLLPILHCDNILTNKIGPVITAHTGPGLLGVIVSPE